ncbi:hypothetical protein ACEWY4_025571 [Coilia grayii]|uniref:Calx-beta domain-containing protein n=1 Tax=Coilia grayii TaxID=363190 RepID=A0ABD1IYA4_9TELE
MRVEEDVGIVSIPVLRRVGTYGLVKVNLVTFGLTALPDLDYIVSQDSVTFNHGQNVTHVNIVIVDDEDSESSEVFEIQLSGATGGAILGDNVIAQVTIAKSDSLSGKIRFLNDSEVVMTNPDVTQWITLFLERVGGFIGNTTIKKFGHPNGIVQFSEADLQGRVYREPSDSEGPLNISLAIIRREGVIGDIMVFWEIVSNFDVSTDFSALSGTVLLSMGENVAELLLTLLPDAVPELEEVYAIHLTAVKGGAELDNNRSIIYITVHANDEPYGVFEVLSEYQQILVLKREERHERHIVLNVTRHAGTFGNVSVQFEVKYGAAGQTILEDNAKVQGSIMVMNGKESAKITVPINFQVFFAFGSNLTIELTDVYLIGPLLSSPPRILLESKIAIVPVPEEAANALNYTWAEEGKDFELETQLVTLVEGQRQAKVNIQILDDTEPEGQEMFVIYLSEAQGGAELVSGVHQRGLTTFSKIIILGSDFHNGILGFTLSSQLGHALDEDSENRTTKLQIQRQDNRAFEDVLVYWRVTLSMTDSSLVSRGINLTKELLQTSGRALCKQGEVLCFITLEVKEDQDPEHETWFLVEIYEVGEGAAINQSARFANITLLESDDPQEVVVVYFALGSRLAVVHLKSDELNLQVQRHSATQSVTVNYHMEVLQKAEAVGPTLIWPAVAGQDFLKTEGTLTFNVGQPAATLQVRLTPDQTSSNPTPKRFRVILTGGAGVKVHPQHGVANVTIVSDTETQAIWALLDQLTQPLNQDIIEQVLQSFNNIVTPDEFSLEQLTALMDALDKILTQAEQIPLEDTSRNLIYNILCSLANPNRRDTRGLSYLAEVAERFAFSLVIDVVCGSEGQR